MRIVTTLQDPSSGGTHFLRSTFPRHRKRLPSGCTSPPVETRCSQHCLLHASRSSPHSAPPWATSTLGEVRMPLSLHNAAQLLAISAAHVIIHHGLPDTLSTSFAVVVLTQCPTALHCIHHSLSDLPNFTSPTSRRMLKSTRWVLSWLHHWNHWSMFDRNHRNTDDTSHAHGLAFSRLGWIRLPRCASDALRVTGITPLPCRHDVHSAGFDCSLRRSDDNFVRPVHEGPT